MPGDSEWNVVSKIHFQVAILASAGLSQGAPQSDPSLARILQEQRYQDDDDKTSGMILMINTNFCTVVKWRRSKIGKSGSRNVLG